MEPYVPVCLTPGKASEPVRQRGKVKNFLRHLGGKGKFNSLNAELIPICHLLALLGDHHIFHVSGLRVKDILPKTTMWLQKPDRVPRLPLLNSEGKLSIC